jgi:hypothetical protein
MVNTTHPNQLSALIFGAGGRLGGTLVGAALKRGRACQVVCVSDRNLV